MSVTVVQANLDVYWEGQAKVTEMEVAMRRLNDTKEIITFYGGQIADWDEADEEVRDSLTARTDSLKVRIDGILERMRMPPGLTGIRADTTVTSRLRQAVGEATGTPYTPSPGRRDQLRWAMQAADDLLAEIEAFYADEVPDYRQALREAGFDPLGG